MNRNDHTVVTSPPPLSLPNIRYQFGVGAEQLLLIGGWLSAVHISLNGPWGEGRGDWVALRDRALMKQLISPNHLSSGAVSPLFIVARRAEFPKHCVNTGVWLEGEQHCPVIMSLPYKQSLLYCPIKFRTKKSTIHALLHTMLTTTIRYQWHMWHSIELLFSVKCFILNIKHS